jgi:arylsulfatase A
MMSFINCRNSLKLGQWFIVLLLIFFLPRAVMSKALCAEPVYNVVIILVDDMGYNDLGCYGGEKITPHIDSLAASGIRFTEFYTSPICSPTRASLMTGCYPQRVGIPGVVSFNSDYGINPEELLLPEMLQNSGYRTALIGKWHLGGREMFHPMKHGFLEFFGTKGSNDSGFDMDLDARRYGMAGVYLFNAYDTVAVHPPQWKFVREYTKHSVKFIESNSEQPFFLLLSHNMPHTPLFVSNDFAGRSQIDIYHDVIMELDWSVGQIMKTLKRLELTESTLVVFMSDNGPWLKFGNHGGSGYPLSGGKKQTLEGGVRVPAIFSLPGVIPAEAICKELVTVMDLYPTIAELTDSEPTKEIIDGKNILSLLKGEKPAVSPHKVYYYYFIDALQAVRSGDYKLQLPYLDTGSPDPANIGYDGLRGNKLPVQRPLALYNLKDDPAEKRDISNFHPEIVQELLTHAADARIKLGDSLEGIKGSEIRSPGSSR